MKTTLILLLILFSVSGHCQKLLSDGIPAPFYALQDQGKNKVMNINSGSAALQMRLDMIRRAKKHIVVEYFIYNTDIAAKIFTRELVAATKRGVKVRIPVSYTHLTLP